MPQKGDRHVDKAYDDFKRYEGVPSCLHCDLASAECKKFNILTNDLM